MQKHAKNTQKHSKNHVRMLTESALMLALATILSLIKIYEFPFGGAVTLFSQLPVILISYRHGIKWGLGTGFSMGIIQALLGLNNYAYIAKTFSSIMTFFFADYFFAFSVLGLGGIFRKAIKNQGLSLSMGAAIASFLRYICHVISGVAIWSEYAEEFSIMTWFRKLFNPILGSFAFWNDQSGQAFVVFYSLCYNGAYMFLEMLISVVALVSLSLLLNLKSERLTPAKRVSGIKP